MTKFVAFVFILCLYFSSSLAQDSKTDSLKQKLTLASPREKIKIYLQLSEVSDNYGEAINYGERALFIANELKDIELQANINFNLGVNHYIEGKFGAAEKCFLESLGFYEKRNDTKSVARAYYWIAMTNKYWGRYRNAAKYAQLGLDMYERIKSVEGIVDISLVFGYIYEAWGKMDQAEMYFDSSLEKIGGKEGTSLGFALLGKGNVLIARGRLDSAKRYFDKSHQQFRKNNNRYGQSLALRDIGEYHLAKKEYQKSENAINESLKILDAINNKRGFAELYILKGDLYFKKGNYAKAAELYQSGQKLAIEMELQEDIVKNYKSISKAFEARKDYSKALKYFRLYSDLKDSVFTSETFEQLSDMQVKYETEKKEKENQFLKFDNKLKQTRIERQYILGLAIVIVLGLVAALAFIFFKGRQKERENNLILEEQKKEIEFSHGQITASIHYASRIQDALLPDTRFLKDAIQGHFILFRPRDIVSGDFYWVKQVGNQLYVVVADCTGHGVPGSFMSVLGISSLSEIMGAGKARDAATILENMREMVKTALKQDNTENTTKDGMDLSMCIINLDTLKLQYAGANMPLYLIRNGRLEIFKGINNPIGVYLKEKPFENVNIELRRGDNLYLFSDGFMDQFGGTNGGKFKITHFRDALLAICDCDMNSQKQLLENIFDEWKSSKYEQTDDVLVMGMKI